MTEKKTDMRRRDFIKGALIGAGTAAATSLGIREAEARAAIPKKWQVEADVIILGLGGAGACAAIEAHDAGARVLILEKQPQHNLINNTRMSGGIFHSPDPTGDREALKSYAKAMFSGENLPWMLEGEQPDVSDGLADAWAKYAPENVDWLKKLDPAFNGVAFSRFSGAAFPQFPGAKECKYRVYGSSFGAKADFDVATKDLPKARKMNGEAFFLVLREAVEKRKIKILWETPASKLISNDRGEVIGVLGKKKGGGSISCKARTLGPIEKGPFYALPLYPGGPNTKGGIMANARREVLDWEGKAIPRLYTAGEISSALKFVYQGGGNLTECIVYGRIARKNAAALKSWK